MSSFTKMAQNSTFLASKIAKYNTMLSHFFEINYFFYSHISKQNNCCFIGSNPDLVAHYAEKEMFQSNPFFTDSDQMHSGIYLYENVAANAFQMSMTTLEKKYDTKHAILLTRRDSSGIHYYGFGRSPKKLHTESLLLNHVPLLQKFSTFFEFEMQKELFELKECAVTLDKFCNSPKTFQCQLSKEKITQFLGKISKSNFPTITFSKRECDVIEHLIIGKSAPHIAKILRLSSRTVEHYITLIKNKCGVSSKAELIELLHIRRNYGIL